MFAVSAQSVRQPHGSGCNPCADPKWRRKLACCVCVREVYNWRAMQK